MPNVSTRSPERKAVRASSATPKPTAVPERSIEKAAEAKSPEAWREAARKTRAALSELNWSAFEVGDSSWDNDDQHALTDHADRHLALFPLDDESTELSDWVTHLRGLRAALIGAIALAEDKEPLAWRALIDTMLGIITTGMGEWAIFAPRAPQPIRGIEQRPAPGNAEKAQEAGGSEEARQRKPEDQDIAFLCTTDIESLAYMLIEFAPTTARDNETAVEYAQVRALAMRIRDLIRLVMAYVTDDALRADARAIVYGFHADRRPA